MEQLNHRQTELLLFLLNHEGFHTSQSIGEHFQVTSRTVRNDADRIAAVLEEWQLDAEVVRKPSEGIKLRTSIKTAQIIKMALEPKPHTLSEPLRELILELSGRRKFIQLQDIMNTYFVSRSKAVQLLDEAKLWLRHYGLDLERRKPKGVRISGDEWNLRRMMKDLSIETERPASFDYDFQLVFQEFNKMEQALRFPLTDRARNNLLYHTLIFIQRLRLGKMIEKTTTDIHEKINNHPEYKLAVQFVQGISEVFQITIPAQEADYFALHLLGSKRERMNEKETLDSWKLLDNDAVSIMEKFIEAVASDFSSDMAYDDDFKRALVLHFQTTLHRLRYQLRVDNPMLAETKKEYASSFEWVRHWTQTVDEPLLKEVPEDEIGFLAIHLQSAIERHRQMNEPVRKVLVVCETGMGTAYLIKEKFNNLFPGIRETEVSSVHNWKLKEQHFHPDLILSTVTIDDERVFQISPVFSKEDQEALVHWMNDKEAGWPAIAQYCDPSLFFPAFTADSREQAIEKLAGELAEKGFAFPSLCRHALEREKMGSTAISPEIAIPHGHAEDVKTSAIAIGILEHPVEWEGETISLIFFIAVEYESSGEAEALFKELFQLSEQKTFTQKVKQAKTYEEFLGYLKKKEVSE
ncbi:BglG family transcription antiterminator [Salibacterium aidingense]|uniref:BglG family transcription antiterminator n=1 Tax=Salibacterium aidingense TaxID=384933 RepID=UPI003BDC3C52